MDDSQGQPRRMALGLDYQRLSMLLAVMHRHGGIHTSGMDVYVNVVGGVKVMETGSDLAVLIACASSIKENHCLSDCVYLVRWDCLARFALCQMVKNA